MPTVLAIAALESKARGLRPLDPHQRQSLWNPLRVWEGEAHGRVQHREASPFQTLINGFRRARPSRGPGAEPLALLPASQPQGAWA
jgi:hypothetical protein